MKTGSMIIIAILALCTICANLNAQSCSDSGNWSNAILSPAGPIHTPLLLTDGRVMVQYAGYSTQTSNQYQDWWALTPDNTGSYTNGSWSELASFSSLWMGNYAPYGFASAVLADGRVIVQGGEHNKNPQLDTNMGTIYDPVGNSWSELQPPGTWQKIGDAQSVILPDKTYMVASCCNPTNFQQALLDPMTLNWNVLLTSLKFDGNNEEGYTLLPNGNVLTIDTGAGSPYYEIFNTGSDSWTHATMPVQLYSDFPSGGEIGPAIVTPDGKVFATGAATVPLPTGGTLAPGNTAIYDPSNGWSTGPTLPWFNARQPLGLGDEMAVLLPDGNVLMSAHSTPVTGSPGSYLFLEYQFQSGTLCMPAQPSSALTQNNDTSAVEMLLLPTGQVFVTNFNFQQQTFSPYYYIYTPRNYTINSMWAPVVSSVNAPNLVRGDTYQLNGYQFNGLSQANMWGDDFQNATNYPLVQLQNNASGHIVYARTHDHSTMGIATGLSNQVYTKFDVPSNAETGTTTLTVVTNGIPSTNSLTVNIQ